MPNSAHSFDFGYIFKTVFSRWYYYVIFAVVLFLIILFLCLKKGKKRNKLSPTSKIVYIGVLSALSVLANVFDIKISDALKISLVASVGFVAGFLMGGGCGFAVCFIGDLLGAIINPQGAYNPIIGIGTGMWGFVPGVIFSHFNGNDYIKTAISYLINFIIVSALINTLGLCLMYSKMTFYYCVSLLPLKLVVLAINALISFGLVVVLKRVMPKNKFNL